MRRHIVNSYIRTYKHTCRHIKNPDVQTLCIHTYIHTCIHTYISTYHSKSNRDASEFPATTATMTGTTMLFDYYDFTATRTTATVVTTTAAATATTATTTAAVTTTTTMTTTTTTTVATTATTGQGTKKAS